MSPRHRCWSVVATLVCLSAIAMQRARAQDVWLAPLDARIHVEAPAARPATSASASAPPHAGALVLTRPLAPETLARVLAEAESLYRARQFEQARQAYATLVELEPLNAHAWLRLGNLHQHAGRDVDALEAYRNATLTVPTVPSEAEARGKALLNVALLHVASASRAIDELDAMRLATLGQARSDVARQVGAQRHRAGRAAERDFDAASVRGAAAPTDAAGAAGAARAPGAAGAPGTSGAPGAAPADRQRPTPDASRASDTDVAPRGPYTVDRWSGRARRAPTRREAPGRGAIVEPLTEDGGLPARPVVESYRGGAAAGRP